MLLRQSLSPMLLPESHNVPPTKARLKRTCYVSLPSISLYYYFFFSNLSCKIKEQFFKITQWFQKFLLKISKTLILVKDFKTGLDFDTTESGFEFNFTKAKIKTKAGFENLSRLSKLAMVLVFAFVKSSPKLGSVVLKSGQILRFLSKN